MSSQLESRVAIASEARQTIISEKVLQIRASIWASYVAISNRNRHMRDGLLAARSDGRETGYPVSLSVMDT